MVEGVFYDRSRVPNSGRGVYMAGESASWRKCYCTAEKRFATLFWYHNIGKFLELADIRTVGHEHISTSRQEYHDYGCTV